MGAQEHEVFGFSPPERGKEAVFPVEGEGPVGKKSRKAALRLCVHLVAWTLEPVTRGPTTLGKLSFLPVEPIMVLTADKNREMGAGDQQEKAAAPLAVPPVTCPRLGVTRHPKDSALLQLPHF